MVSEVGVTPVIRRVDGGGDVEAGRRPGLRP